MSSLAGPTNSNGATTNTAGKKRSLDDALDSVLMGSSGDTAPPLFLAASAFEGSKPGYYFGTGPHGVGYYLDNNDDLSSSSSNKKQEPKKKARKGVQFADDRNETRVVLNPQQLLEQAEEQAKQQRVIDLTPKGVVNAGKALAKAVERNALQRAQYVDDPANYMESEVALYEHIQVLTALAADPIRLYPALVEHRLLAEILIPLLMHENTDIVSAVITVFVEWFDPALLSSTDENDDDNDNNIDCMSILALDLMENGGIDFLVDNLGRFSQQGDDETQNNNEDEDVGGGIEGTLSLIEALMELDMVADDGGGILLDKKMSVAAMLGKETRLVSWLLKQVENDSSAWKNRTLELLALLTPREDVYAVLDDWSQIPPYTSSLAGDENTAKKEGTSSNGNGEKKNNGDATIDAIELLLQEMAIYRKKQPIDEEQLEALENAGIILASLLTYSSKNVQAFVDRQGIELVVRFLKERVHAGGIALKLLDFSNSDAVNQRACEHIVNAGALKFLFPIYMGRNLPKVAMVVSSKKTKKEWKQTIEKTIIRILYNLVRNLTDQSPNDAKERLLSKFVDDEKCDRIVDLCISYDQKARLAEYKFYRSEVEEELRDESAVQLAALDAKLSAGGDIFHRVTAIAAFCCVGSKRCHERILGRLESQQSGISLIREGLQEFASVLEESPQRRQLEGYLDDV